jgi:hypothetical protein
MSVPTVFCPWYSTCCVYFVAFERQFAIRQLKHWYLILEICQNSNSFSNFCSAGGICATNSIIMKNSTLRATSGTWIAAKTEEKKMRRSVYLTKLMTTYRCQSQKRHVSRLAWPSLGCLLKQLFTIDRHQWNAGVDMCQNAVISYQTVK